MRVARYEPRTVLLVEAIQFDGTEESAKACLAFAGRAQTAMKKNDAGLHWIWIGVGGQRGLVTKDFWVVKPADSRSEPYTLSNEDFMVLYQPHHEEPSEDAQEAEPDAV